MRRHRLGGLAAASMVTVLAGCFPFGPFSPFGPLPSGELDLTVENASDEDWVLRVTTDSFPLDYAVPAQTTATAYLYGGTLDGISLLDLDCDEIAELEMTADAPAAVHIGAGGSLTTTTDPGEPADAPLAEYFECSSGTGFGQPEPGEPIADAPGVLVVVGGDGSAWQVEPATAALEQLVAMSPGGMDGEHALSPDGTRVAFSRYDEEGFSSDLVVAAIGASPDESEILVEDAGSPAWSPDGDRIAFLNLDPFAGGSTLAVIDADGGEPTELAANASVPRWSPDGAKLAFIVEDAGSFTEPIPGPAELWVVNADGTGARMLADAAPFAGMPSWSPDGTRIAFISGDESTTEVSVLDVESGDASVVAAEEGAFLSEAAWSPDGTRIAFVASTASLFSATSHVGVVNATGGAIEVAGAEQPGAYLVAPTWSPDGAWIAVSRSTEEAVEGELLVLEPGGTTATVVATGVQFIADWRIAASAR